MSSICHLLAIKSINRLRSSTLEKISTWISLFWLTPFPSHFEQFINSVDHLEPLENWCNRFRVRRIRGLRNFCPSTKAYDVDERPAWRCERQRGVLAHDKGRLRTRLPCSFLGWCKNRTRSGAHRLRDYHSRFEAFWGNPGRKRENVRLQRFAVRGTDLFDLIHVRGVQKIVPMSASFASMYGVFNYVSELRWGFNWLSSIVGRNLTNFCNND